VAACGMNFDEAGRRSRNFGERHPTANPRIPDDRQDSPRF
jgi:hypothetical protein